MGTVFLETCELDGDSQLDIHADSDGDIWIVTDGHGSVMLSPETARKAAQYLIELADSAEGKQG